MPKKHEVAEARERPMYGLEVHADKVYKFQSFRWREAIMQFLNCLWTERFQPNDTLRLTVLSGEAEICSAMQADINLSFHRMRRTWESTGVFPCQNFPAQICEPGDILWATAQGHETESALARFAKNRSFKVLVLRFPDCPHVREFALWDQGSLHILNRGAIDSLPR